MGLLALPLSHLQSTPSAEGERPNILLAIADDLDPDHLGFCGNALARTPTLDRLAAEGAYFPVLYVQPVCRASLATLLSGRWPQETGILNNRVSARLDPAGTLPRRLKERGYATFCAGKFWEGAPADYGFDAPERNDEDFARATGEGQPELFRFLEEHAPRGPWFVWWAPNLPHVPHRPPAHIAEAFADVPLPAPRGFAGSAEEYARAERACLAMESWLDERFGELLHELDELGELDETVIVFLADNGWSTVLPAKGTPREKGVRSPLVVRLPGQEARQLDALVALVDVHATLLDYAGAAPDGRGRSLRPLLEDRAYERRERLFGSVFTRSRRGGEAGELCALYARDARWKYVLYVRDVASVELSADSSLAPPFRRRAGAEELFDLHADPLEELDLSAREEHAERLRDLRAAVLGWWRASGGAAPELPARDER